MLNQKEIQIIEQTLNIPMYAFGKKQFEDELCDNNFSLEKVKKLLLKLNKQDDEYSYDEVKLIIISMLVAMNISGVSEYQTLTGYSWEESIKLILKLLRKL